MPHERALTVSQAMGLAKRALEGVAVSVLGEVTELTDRPGYKAVYFTLGDGDSVMPCLMWRDAYESSGVRLECGALVEVGGAFTAYPPKGRMQFQARTLAAAGEGVLRLQVAARARKLEAEGLMRPERKRALPAFPERVALVTSPRGKAVHDVLRTLRRRYPLAELLVAGIAVEGADAAASIVRGLEAAAAAAPDVVILARGGGSYEDMMPFNAEEVARAVAACPVPVVSGIGHEPDTTIADMVADVRASTPTAAAEAVAPSVEEMGHRTGQLSSRLARGLAHRAQAAEHAVRLVAGRALFRDPVVLFATRWQRLDVAASGLARALPGRLAGEAVRVEHLGTSLARSARRCVERTSDRLARDAARLEDLSPLAILGRGYSVTYDEAGERVVRSATEVSPGDRVRVRVGDGSLGCLVETAEMEA